DLGIALDIRCKRRPVGRPPFATAPWTRRLNSRGARYSWRGPARGRRPHSLVARGGGWGGSAGGSSGAGLGHQWCNLRCLPGHDRGIRAGIAEGRGDFHLRGDLLAGIVAPLIEGFMAGFKINAVILIASGTLGLLLL